MKPQTHSTHWADIGESTFATGLLFLYGVHRWLGRWPFRLFLYPVVFYYWASRPLARRASLDYLRRLQAARAVFPRPPGGRQGLHHFLAFADSLLDKLLALSGRYRFEHMRFTGREPVLAMIQRGQGGIFVTAHVGCLELCRAAAADYAHPFQLTVLVHTAHAERFNRILQRLGQADGAASTPRVQLMQVSEITPATAVLLAEKVARGEFVAIAGDRVPVTASKTVRVPFLGAQAAFPIGPYVLAALLRCPLYLMACTRVTLGGGRHTYQLHFECLAEHATLPRASRDAALTELATRYARSLEDTVARSPYDWFNFYPFWDAPAHPLANGASP
ncbi:acyltransferase [Hylemonella gracilis]|uniref:Acyltransferase n=1 Tax=Hylemonella gracilis TaxID=80880 RepID=A0A4P6UIU2_9BURK|nr:acyltransferase [Hylemonella gracilis]QBK05258.1 acyltransferase [Hylemonella gracilis]